MRLPAGTALLLITFLSVPLQASPEETTYAPPLHEVIETALGKAPVLAAATSRYSSAKAAAKASFALPDPYMELTGQAMGISPIGPSSSLVLEYRQELLFPGKRAARQSSSHAYAQIFEKETEEIKASVREEVSIHYANIYSLDRELRAIADAEAFIISARKAASGRYETGLSGKRTLIRLDIEAAKLRQRKAGARASRLAEASLINRYIGAPVNAPFGEVSSLPSIPPADMNKIESGIDSSPIMAKLKAREESALLKMKELKLEEMPDFMLGGGGGLDGDVNPVLMLRLGLNLPIFRETKQRNYTESAMHDYSAAKAELADAKSRLLTEASVMSAELNKTGIIISEYTGSIIPNSKAVFESTLAAYASGEGDYLMLIEDLNALIDARAGLAKAESERLSISARLERLTGISSAPSAGKGEKP